MSSVRDAAAVRFFPPGIPLLVLVATNLLERFVPLDLGWSLDSHLRAGIGYAIVALAILIFGFWPVTLFRRAGQSENPWKPTPKIETRGPFCVTRNPMYLQMVLICLGFGIAWMNWWTLLAVPFVAVGLYWAAIEPEEEYLERKFGEEYLEYKKRVRRWL